MKKTFIAASVLGLMVAGTATAADETVNVTFLGEVKDLTCTVQVGGPDNVVNLGMLDAEAKARGTIVPVMFRFSGCKSGTKLSAIKLTGAQNGTPAEENLEKGVLGTDNDNVLVQLMTNVEGAFSKEVSYEKNQNALDIESGGAVTPYFAQLQADAVNAPEPGPVRSAAVFTVVYK